MLRHEIEKVAREAGATAVATAFHDYETRTSWSLRGDEWFHAASTMKVAVLLALFDAVKEGRFELGSRLHVRNRFLSIADREPFRVPQERDASPRVQAKIGHSLRIGELAEAMIVQSSNLATNLLLELVGVAAAQASLDALGLRGIELRRGVEDHAAFEAGLNNRVTALGLLGLFRALQERRAVSDAASREMLAILSRQEFRGGIPAGIPPEVRDEAAIANKTGEISTVAHDAAVVALPAREPYALVVLSEWPATVTAQRRETLATISRLVFEHLVGGGDGGRETTP